MEKVLKISLDSSPVKAALDALKGPTDKASEAFKRMVNEAKGVGKELEKNLGGGAKQSANDMQEAFKRMGDRTKRVQEQFSSSFHSMKNAAKDAATQTSGSFSSMEKASDTLLKKVVGLAGALAGGFGFVAMLKNAAEIEKSVLGIAGALGVTKQEAEGFANIANDIYMGAWGESLDQTSKAVVSVTQNLKDLGVTSKSEIQSVTQDVLTLSSAYGTDYQENINATSILMKQFGLSSKEALDFVSAGYQRGLNSSGNFTDSITEYATQFANGGASAEQFFSTLQTGYSQGSLSSDKALDAFKEFRLRIQDGSKTTFESLELLGFSSQDLMQRLGNGTTTVAKAFQEVTQKLNETGDASLRMQAGAGLLGTQFEDLGDSALKNIDLAAVKMSDLSGAMERSNVVNQSLSTTWSSFTRSLANSIAGSDAFQSSVNSLNKTLSYLTDNMDSIVSGGQSLLKIIGAGGLIFVGMKAISATIGIATVASNAFTASVARLSVASATGASSVAAMNTSLYGTSVAAQTAGNSMAKLRVAGQAAFTGFIGWELGSYFFNEFESVRNYAYGFIGKMEEYFLSIQYYTQVTTTIFKGSFQEATDFVSDTIATGSSYAQQSILSIQSAFAILSGTGRKIIGEMVSWIMDKFGAMVSGLASAMSYADFIPGLDQASSGLSSLSASIKSSSESMKSMGVAATESIDATIEAYTKQSEAINKNKEAIQSIGGSKLKDELTKLSTEFDKNRQKIRDNVSELQTFSDTNVQAITVTKSATQSTKLDTIETDKNTKSLAASQAAEKIASDTKKAAKEQETAARKLQAEENKQAKAEAKALKAALNEQAKQIDGTAKSYRDAAKALGEHINELKRFHSALTEAQEALVASGMTEYEKELYTGVKELGTEYGAQVAVVKNLAKAQSELVSIQLEQQKINAQSEIQALRAQGVSQQDIDREIKYKQLRIELSQKYTKVVAEELVQQQRFVDASKEQIEVQKKVADSRQLVNESSLNDKQREYVKLMREVGVENAKQIVQNQELAAARSKGASTLASLQEEYKLLRMTSEEQKRYNAIKDAAPEQYDAITLQLELNEAIQASKARLDEAGKIAGSYFEKFVSGSVSGKEALKAMAGEISAFASKELFAAARDQLQGLAGKKSNAELVGNVVDDNLAKATKWFDENTSKVVNSSQDFSGTIAKAVDEAGKKVSTSIDGFAKQINDAITQQKTYEKQADALEKAAQAMKDSASQIGDAANDIGGAASNFISSGSKRLGFLSEKYEVGSGGAGTISTGKGDKGGKSYGSWQLASKVGTLGAFVRSKEASPFASMLKSAKLASAEFDKIWKNLAKNQKEAFESAQHSFIKRTHYDPAAKYASSKGFDMSNDAIKNMIWSGSVQHGGVKKIIANVAKYHQSALSDVDSTIKAFYEERTKYAAKHHKGLQSRYKNEEKDAIAYASILKKGGDAVTKSVEKVDKAVASVKPPVEKVSEASKVLADTQGAAVNIQKEMATKVQAIQQQQVEVGQKELVSSSAHNEAMAAVEMQRQAATMKDAEVIVVHAQATEQGAVAMANVAAMTPSVAQAPQGGLGGLTSAISGVFQKGMFEQGGLFGGASSLFGADKIDSIMAGGGLSSIFSGDLGGISGNVGQIFGSVGGTQALSVGMNLLSGEFENAAVDAAALAASMTPLGPLGGAAVKAFSSFAGVGAEWVKEAEWITVDIKGLSASFQKGIRETKDAMIGGGTRTSYSDVSKEELEKLNEQFATIRDSVEQLNDSLSSLDINLMKGMGDYQAHIEDREGLGAEVFAKSMEEAQKQMLTHAIENMQIAGVDNDATKSLQENVANQVSGRISDLMGLFTDMTSKIDFDMAVADSTWNGDLDRILGQNEVNSKEYHEKLTTGLLDYVQNMDLGNMNVDEIQADLAQKTQAMFSEIGVHDIPQSTFDSLSQTLATRINDAILFVQTGVSEFAITEDTGFFSTLRSMTQTFEGSAEELKKFIDNMVALKGTFKESGLSTDAITETFIDAAGGLDKLKASTSTFKDKFVSETEAQSLAIQDALGGVNKAIASTGIVLPQTREGFAELVQGLSNAGADSEEALAKLIKTSDKFDLFYTAVEGFNQNFLKLPESLKPIGGSVDGMVTELGKLGVSIPKTRQEFTELVTGLDVTDVAQSKLYTSLISISPAVDTVFSSIESLGGGLSESQTRFTAYSTSLTDVTQVFSDLGVTVPNSVTEFNSLIQSIDLTSESGQSLYSSLMSATPVLNQLYDAAQRIVGVDASNVGSALQKGIDAGEQGGDAGATFYSSFMEDIQSSFMSSTLNSVSTIIMDSVVTPMINSSVQSATNLQMGSVNAGTNLELSSSNAGNNLATSSINTANNFIQAGNQLAQAGANAASNLAQAGANASSNLDQAGANASQDIASGGSSASQSLIIGGRLSGDALATAIDTAKQVMLANAQVMDAIKNDTEFQREMMEFGNMVFSNSASFTATPIIEPKIVDTTNTIPADDIKETQSAFNDLNSSLSGNEVELHKLGKKYKDTTVVQEFASTSGQELGEKLKKTNANMKDLSTGINEHIDTLDAQKKAEEERKKAEEERRNNINKYNEELSEQIVILSLSEKELEAHNKNKEYQRLINETIEAGGDLAKAEQINTLKKAKVADEQVKAIANFERQYKEQIDNVNKSSQQLDLDKLATEFESALQQANELGADTVIVTQAFEQQRADIIKEYADENSNAIKSLQSSIIDMSSFRNATKESQAAATAKGYGVDLGQAVVGSDIQGIINDAVNYSEQQWIGLMQSVGVAIDATNITKFKDDLSGVASVALQLQSQFSDLQNSLELVAGTSDESTQKLMEIAKQFPGIGIAVDGNTVAIQGMVMTSKQAANDLLGIMKNPAEFAKLASKVGIESQEDFMNAASSIIGAMKEMDAKADATEATMNGLHEAMADIKAPMEGAQKTLKDLDKEFGGFVTSSNLFGQSAVDVANAVDSIPINTLTGVSMQYGLSIDQVTAKVISGVQALNQIQGQVTAFQQQQQEAAKVASGVSQHELVLDELKKKYQEFPDIIAAISKEGLTSLDVQQFVGDMSNPTEAVAGLSEASGYSIQSILDDVTKLEGALDGINGQAAEVSNATTDLKNSLKIMAGETDSTALSLDGFKNKYPDLIKNLGLGGASVETLNLKLGGLSDKQFEKYADKAGVATTELIADMKSFSENTKTISDQTAERTAKISGFIGDMDRTSSTLDDVEYSMKKLGQTSPELVNYLQTLGKNSYEISASLASMDTAQVDNLTKVAEGMGYSLDRAIEESKTYIDNLRSQEERKSEAEKAALEERQKRDQEALEAAKKAQEEQRAAMEKANEERQAAMEKAAQEQQAAYEKQQDELMKQVDGLFSVFDKLADKIASTAEGLATSIKSFYSEDQLKQLDQTKLSSLRGDIFKPRATVDINNPDSTERLLDNIDEYQRLLTESRKDEIANIEKLRDEAQAGYDEELTYRQGLHESALQITTDIGQSIGEITKTLGQADSAATVKQNLLDSFVNESDFEKKLEIAKQIPSAIKAAMDEEIALDEKRIESAKAAREAQEKLNESIRKGLSSSTGIREKIVGGQDPIAKFQSLMAKISPDMMASEENIQLIQDAQNAAYESYQAQIDSQKKLEDDRFNSAKKHIEDEKKGIDELRKQSESFLKSVSDFRRQGKTDTRVLELEQAGFQELLAKYKAGDTSSATLDALRAAGTSYVQQGEKVYGSAKEQTGTGGIIEQVSSVFEEIGLSLGQQADRKEANLPLDETITGENVTAIKEIQENVGAQTLEQLGGLDAILNSMLIEPSPLPESQVEAIRTGASEQLAAFNEQMLLLTEQLNPENQPKFDDSEFAVRISETQAATISELQMLSQMTMQLDTELKSSLQLSLAGIYDRLSPENQSLVAARLETAIQRDITAPLRELGVTFTTAIGSLGSTISKIQADAKAQIASANAAASAAMAKVAVPATTKEPPLIVDKATGKIVPVGAPRMAEGGVVTKPTYAYIGEGGESEVVIPLSKLPELVQRVTLQGNDGADVRELVRSLSAIIKKDGNNKNNEVLLVKILEALNKLNVETKNGFKSQQRAIEERKLR